MNPHSMTDAELDALVGFNLRCLREDAGTPAATAAARLGMDEDRLGAIEAGAAHATVRELCTAVLVLRCGFGALFRWAEPARLAS